MDNYKITRALGVASKLQSDIEKWYLDSSEQIKHLKEICNEIANQDWADAEHKKIEEEAREDGEIK